MIHLLNQPKQPKPMFTTRLISRAFAKWYRGGQLLVGIIPAHAIGRVAVVMTKEGKA